MDLDLEKMSKAEKLEYLEALIESTPIPKTAMILSVLQKGEATSITSDAHEQQIRHRLSLYQKGNLGWLEEMLITQIGVLNSVFLKNLEQSLLGPEAAHSTFAKMAMQAQRQSMQTISTLVDLRQPRGTTLVRNHAVNQQINLKEPLLRELAIITNELLRSPAPNETQEES